MKKPHIKFKSLKQVEKLSFEESDIFISESELMRQLNEKKGYSLYLGVFTRDEVQKVLRSSHIWHDLTLKGFANLILDINTDDPHRHILRVYFDRADKAHMLIEIILSESIFKPKVQYVPTFRQGTYNMLVIEWLVLQNPILKFSPEKPQLPDQQYPGLGIARRVGDMLVDVSRYLHKDGILNFPQYYHNAVIYSEIFRFYNPYMQGMLKAIEKSLSKYPLAESSSAVSLGCVKNLKDGGYFKWKAEELILPISAELNGYFASKEYDNICNNTMKEYSFDIDWILYKTKINHAPR